MQPGLDSPEFPPTIPPLNSSTIMSFRTLVLPVLGAALLALVPCRAADPAELSSPADGTPRDILADLSNPQGDANPDPVIKSLGTELMGKALPLARSFGANAELASTLGPTLQALTANQLKPSLTGLQRLSEAKLTAEQAKLFGDFGNLAHAYLAQRNLATLPDAKSDVAQLVSSLRQGKITEAVPVLQKISQNAKLTAPQKELVTALVAKFAPATGKAADAVGSAAKALPAAAK